MRPPADTRLYPLGPEFFAFGAGIAEVFRDLGAVSLDTFSRARANWRSSVFAAASMGFASTAARAYPPSDVRSIRWIDGRSVSASSASRCSPSSQIKRSTGSRNITGGVCGMKSISARTR